MPSGATGPNQQPADLVQQDSDPGDPKGFTSFTLSVSDWSGQQRKGQVIITWQKHLAELTPLDSDESFRIVILGKPIEDAEVTTERLAACVPARPLTWRPAVREAALAYGVRADGTLTEDSPLLPRRDVQALSGGRIHSALDLDVGPELVFTPEGYVHLEPLAQDILLQAALKPYRAALSLALAAPAAPSPAKLDALQQELRQLAKKASLSLSQEADPNDWPEAALALERLEALSQASDPQEFLAWASQTYVQLADCAEDVYLARALLERRQEALKILAMRRFMAQAAVPAEHPDLALDRTILENQLSLAELVAEPHRLAGTLSSFTHFQERYRPIYIEHHNRYWREAVAIHGRLMDAGQKVDCLRKLNTLTELGPPVGEGSIVAFAQLLEETAGCQRSGRLEEELGDNAVCPSCGLTLGQEPPRETARDVLDRIDRACRRQLTRLSATAVQQVLARSGDPRVEQFLKVVQASQLASLDELLDDALLGFLRRFLVEARIQAVLQPIIDRLQTGPPPQEGESEQVMKEVSRVLQRAFRAASRSLPAPPSDTDITLA